MKMADESSGDDDDDNAGDTEGSVKRDCDEGINPNANDSDVVGDADFDCDDDDGGGGDVVVPVPFFVKTLLKSLFSGCEIENPALLVVRTHLRASLKHLIHSSLSGPLEALMYKISCLFFN